MKAHSPIHEHLLARGTRCFYLSHDGDYWVALKPGGRVGMYHPEAMAATELIHAKADARQKARLEDERARQASIPPRPQCTRREEFTGGPLPYNDDPNAIENRIHAANQRRWM